MHNTLLNGISRRLETLIYATVTFLYLVSRCGVICNRSVRGRIQIVSGAGIITRSANSKLINERVEIKM